MLSSRVVEILGRREQRKQDVRDAIVAAAMKLLTERRFDDVTIDDIAATAGISRRSYFRYFPTKEAAVFPRHDARVAQFRETLKTEASNGGFPALRKALLQLATDYGAHKEEFAFQQRLVSTVPDVAGYEANINADWEMALKDALSELLPTVPSIDLEIISAQMIAAMRVTLRVWALTEGADLVVLGNRVIDFLERGVGHLFEAQG